MNLIKILFIFSHFLLIPSLWAQITSTFGPEFTFTNKALIRASDKAGGHVVNTDANEGKRDEMSNVVKKKCPDCVIEEKEDKYGVTQVKVTHPDGLWFVISVDPAVVEVQMKPLTLAEIKQNRDLIQDLIFDSAKQVGINPHQSVGGGHIHMDLKSSFQDKPELFLNFITDFQNHPGVAMGVLDDDPYNAPVIGVQAADQREAYKRIVDDFANSPVSGQKSILKLAKDITKKVYFKTYSGWNPPQKYQAVNIVRIVDSSFAPEEKTLEIRSLRPQRSVDDYILEAQMFESRLNLLDNKGEIIPYDSREVNIYRPSFRQQAVDDFYRYVTDAGLSWEDYKNLLPPDLVGVVPSPLKIINCQNRNTRGRVAFGVEP